MLRKNYECAAAEGINRRATEERENPEQTEEEKTEVLQELEIHLCKTPAGRRIWRKKVRGIKRYVMSSSA
jgi:hypothetical protein